MIIKEFCCYSSSAQYRKRFCFVKERIEFCFNFDFYILRIGTFLIYYIVILYKFLILS